jgi:DNA-binding transcriptional ArsR family regulator
MTVSGTEIKSGLKVNRSDKNWIRTKLPGYYQLNAMSQFFGLLADPTRLQIVIALRVSELCVHDIAATIGLSVSAVSHQLRLLKTAKIVKYRREGKMIHYTLDDEHVEQLLHVAELHVAE